MSEAFEIRVHKIALNPTPAQEEYFWRAAGIARFAWNWALDRWQKMYAAHREDPSLPKPSTFTINKELNAIKHSEFPWMQEVAAKVPECSVQNLGDAFKRFFSGHAHYPKSKAKGRSRDSFRAVAQASKFRINERQINVPRLGWLRMREELRFKGEPSSAMISREADRWFITIHVRCAPSEPLPAGRPAVGVDLGITDLAVLSDGRRVKGPRPLKRRLRQLRRASRVHSRKVNGSANKKKSARRLARIHARIANIRKDGLHKLTTMLVREHGQIVIEDLNVTGLLKNRHLACSIGDMGFGEFRRQLTYKAARAGTEIIIADRFFASSKTCSACGSVKKALPLSVRKWTCANCGARHDRDINAAINLRNLAGSKVSLRHRPVTACGAESAGAGSDPGVKLAAVKQELVCVQEGSFREGARKRTWTSSSRRTKADVEIHSDLDGSTRTKKRSD